MELCKAIFHKNMYNLYKSRIYKVRHTMGKMHKIGGGNSRKLSIVTTI